MRKLQRDTQTLKVKLRYWLRSSLRSSRRCFSYALNSAFISSCAQQHMCQASANLKCRQKVWNHPGLARRRRLLLLLLALARVLGLGRGLGRGWLESGPFFKGHDLLEVENQ